MQHTLVTSTELLKPVATPLVKPNQCEGIARSSVQVQICMPAAGGGQVLQSFKLCCQVERSPRGGAGLTLHSGIKLHNSCGLLLSIGMQQRWPAGMTDNQTWTTCLIAPGSSAWLPALCCNATYLSLQPAGQSCFPSSFFGL